PAYPFQDCLGQAYVCLNSAAAYGVKTPALHAELLRLDRVRPYVAAAGFVDECRGRYRDLVEPILPVHDKRVFGTHETQHPSQRLAQPSHRDTSQLTPRTRRVGDRSKDVEDRPHPDLTP